MTSKTEEEYREILEAVEEFFEWIDKEKEEQDE